MDSCFSFGHACSCSFSDYDKSASLQCAVMTENECRISFNVVASETQTTAYNLQIYGDFTAKKTSFSEMEFLYLNQCSSSLFFSGCPEPPKIPMIMLGLSLSIVCVGLIVLVVWKVLVSVHDRKEVARFEAERSNAKWQSVR